MADAAPPSDGSSEHAGTRRDFLVLAAGAMGGMAVVGVTWPLIETMNPTADVLALASIEVDLSAIEEGQTIVVKWRGRPVFVRYRTAEEIAAAQAVELGDLSDPQPDSERAPQAQWLIVEGVCTHLGCVPLGSKIGDPRGEFGGWFWPLPRLALRHLRPHPQGAGAGQSSRAELRVPRRRTGSDRVGDRAG